MYQPDVLFVGLDIYKEYESEFVRPDYKTRYDALEGWSGSCGKVIKKELATRQECLYNEGTLKEDKNQHCRVCIHMRTFDCLSDPVYVWNRTNKKSVTTKRDDILWQTSTIRHYADTQQLYLTYKGQDYKLDQILKNRIKMMEEELDRKGDRQF